MCLDYYLRPQRLVKTLFETCIAGLALAIWSTGTLYATEMSDIFSAYLLSYAFPAIISFMMISLSCLSITGSNMGAQSNSNTSQNQNKSAMSISMFDRLMPRNTTQQQTQTVRYQTSYNDKLGVSIFGLGLLVIMVLSPYYITHYTAVGQTSAVGGNVIAILS